MGQIVSDVTEVLDYKQAKKESRSARKQVLQQMAEDEVAKTNLVKKALATQRAKYGAAGMDGAGQGTTEEAVLKRIREETEEPYTAKRKANLEKLKQTKVKKTNLLKKFLDRFESGIA